MKFFSLLILIFHSCVFAESYSEAQLVQRLRMLKGKIEPSFLDGCREEISPVKIDCFNFTEEVLRDYIVSNGQLNRLHDQVADSLRNLLQAPGSKDLQKIAFTKDVLNTVNCMRSEFTSFRFRCLTLHHNDDKKHCPSMDVVASTKRNSPEKIINLCPRYFYLDSVNRAGAILHELSHKCGARDYESLGTGMINQFKSRPHPSGARNADNFRLWSVFGFSYP